MAIDIERLSALIEASTRAMSAQWRIEARTNTAIRASTKSIGRLDIAMKTASAPARSFAVHHVLEGADLGWIGQLDMVMVPVDGGATMGQSAMVETLNCAEGPPDPADALFRAEHAGSVPVSAG